jgi:hypothetical protein
MISKNQLGLLNSTSDLLIFNFVLGVITFSPMNYQKMRDAPMNYQLGQNRAFNYQRQPFSPLPSVKGVKTNGQWVT